MYKKVIYRLLAFFLFVFISVSFLVPSDLVAETRKFWVKDGHYEDQDFWVTSGYLKDTQEKRWVDTSHMVESGYWETKKEWVDTSHMVYQGYWKNVAHNVWVDTSQWVSDGYWKYLTERVWVTSGYTAYRDVNKWVDTSHMVWVSSGYTAYRDVNVWVDTSHWEKQAYNVWVSSGYTASRWVDTSHNVWVMSGYTASRWVSTSHWVWVSSGYWRYNRYGRYWVNTSHNVWVESGYWQSYWVNTSHWTWVSSGYTTYYWVDTSHYETRYRDVWVMSGYNKTVKEAYWVDTSHMVWVNSGYWTTVREAYWVDTSHWEDQKVGVPGHLETRDRYVEDWQPASLTIYTGDNSYQWVIYSIFAKYQGIYTITYNGNKYHAEKYVIETWSTQPISTDPNDMYGGWLYIEKYECYEVLNWKKESYPVWVDGDWKKEWVDTSHWVKSGYWQSYTYRTWVDTSHMVESGYWETKKEWVDTSHMVESGYWEDYTKRTWVDTSHSETRDVWVDTSHWVEAELDPEGKVLHTDQWNENRIKYNLSITGDPDKPRPYEVFFNGEKFVLEADTPGDFQPESVHVEFLGTNFETDLTKTGDIKWEGYIWDESFIYFHDRECVFKFTASYDYNGDKFEIEDEVTVYVVRGEYWRLRRLF